jgi:hypothetical protein
MIYVVIGGCLSGKSRLVMDRFLGDPSSYERVGFSDGIIVTRGAKGAAIGQYTDNSRGGGVDHLQHKEGKVQKRVAAFLRSRHKEFASIAIEGNALHSNWFFDQLYGLPVTLVYLQVSGRTLQENAKGFDLKWILPTHRRAAKVWAEYKEKFPNEIVCR